MKHLIEKLFFTKQYFTIGIRKNNSSDDYRYILATNKRWFADPMIATEGHNSYVFYEATNCMHGHIEVAEINEDYSIGEPTVILSGEYHYSYPFVFKYGEDWFLIPETSDQGKVCLYRAVKFPYKWKMETTLLHAKAVDTTVFELNDRWYMLTFLINGVNEIVIPKAYELDMSNYRIGGELEWIKPDGLKTRGAGSVFEMDGKYYRPAQINTENTYGEGVVIYEIVQCGKAYEEKAVNQMDMPAYREKERVATGMHTFTKSNNFEAVDVRIREFDLFKIPKRLWKKAGIQ